MTGIIDRRYSVAEGISVKAPVRAATTANITLAGEQTIDGVAVTEDERVLVKDQTDATENGIYEVSTGNWGRSRDFDGALDAVLGTRVFVTAGTTSGGFEFYVSAPSVSPPDSIDFDTDEISFTRLTPPATDDSGPSVLRYIPTGLHSAIAAGTNTTPLTTYIQTALTAEPELWFPKGTYLSGGLTAPSGCRLLRGPGELEATGTFAGWPSTSFLNVSNTTDLTIIGLKFSVNKTTYSSSNVIGAGTATRLRILHNTIAAGGNISIGLFTCTDCVVSGNYVAEFNQNGLHAQDGSGNQFTHNRIIGDITITGHTTQFLTEDDLTVEDNFIYGGPVAGFGVYLQDVERALVARNQIRNTNNEGLAARGIDISVLDNHLVWDGSTSQDYGMSFNNTDSGNVTHRLVIKGNFIRGAGKTGIAVGGYCEDTEISNNTVLDVVGSLDASHCFGIEVGDPGVAAGAEICLRTVVRNNVIKLVTGNMTYAVKELDGADYSIIENNYAFGMLTGFNPVANGAHSLFQNNTNQ